MLRDTCLVCRTTEITGEDPELRAMVEIAETLGIGLVHHHHTVACEDCKTWWFDNYVTGGLGLPVPARRDTVVCTCPEDGASRFIISIIQAPMPESECNCTAAEVEASTILIRLGED